MAKIKCSVYLIRDSYYPTPNLYGLPADYSKFFNNRPKFCDAGDDPSFYCSQKFKSNVTWGVCRHNVRQALNIEDEVHFVACDKTDKHFWKYYYVGYGLVEEKITHKDIVEKNEYELFQKYFNTLIKPQGNGFKHFEKLPSEYWHDDWKMRISSKRTYKQLEEVEEDLEYGICGISATKKKKSKERITNIFPFGNNYIIFNKDKSYFNIASPIRVAEVQWSGRQLFTKWTSDKIQKLFSNEKLRDSFTNKSRQHTIFELNPQNISKLKSMILK